jgi:hypothetical protein
MNLFPEIVESGLGKARTVLYGTPGIETLQAMPTPPIRGLFSFQDVARLASGPRDRLFVASGNYVYEVYSDWTFVPEARQAFDDGDNTGPVRFACNGQQICIATGRRLYCYDLTTNQMTSLFFTIHNADGTTAVGDPIIASDVEELDGFFFCLITNTNQFNASANFNGADWDQTDFAFKTGSSDIAVGLASDHGQLWIMGSASAETWYDAGNANFPLGRNQSGFMERGLLSLDSLINFDDGIFWLGQEDSGAAVAYRNSGYASVRVSNHSVESAMNSYPTVTDAISSCYVEAGHHFWCLHFPSANDGDGTTWVYDTATSMWHERGFWLGTPGKFTSMLGRFHTYAFGVHVLGDWRTTGSNGSFGPAGAGNLYRQSMDLAYDAVSDYLGQASVFPIRRLRRGPPISVHMDWTYFHEFQLDMQMGAGVPPWLDPAIWGRIEVEPTVILRFSDDGGYTWSNEMAAHIGNLGQYTARAMWRRLGKSRDRVFEVVITDPMQVVLIAAYLRMSSGSGA